VGLKVVNGFNPYGPDQWSGVIYNADDGHRYKAYLKVENARTALLQGCVFTVLCRGHTWTRAD
jgi:uncharacterized protein (DUF2147 family)